MLLKQYNEIIQDQLEHGIIEEEKSEAVVGNVTLTPQGSSNESKFHHVSSHVYDVSAEPRNQASWNEILYKGPFLNPELYKLLLQFHVYPVAITADIEKAYHEINIEEKGRDYLRFLRFTNSFNDEEVKICKYCFARVIFGATCSQYLLNTTVNKHTQKYVDIDKLRKLSRG